MYFDMPVQVRFQDVESEGWFSGIAYHDVVICNCCGGTFDIDEILEENPNGIIEMNHWTNIPAWSNGQPI